MSDPSPPSLATEQGRDNEPSLEGPFGLTSTYHLIRNLNPRSGTLYITQCSKVWLLYPVAERNLKSKYPEGAKSLQCFVVHQNEPCLYYYVELGTFTQFTI